MRGIAPDVQGRTFFSCGDDKTIKQWEISPNNLKSEITPLRTILSTSPLLDIDHHWRDDQFATSGDSVCLWDSDKNTPLLTYKWGSDSIVSVRFNPSEACLLGSTGSDRSNTFI